ncbi:MAG TPA: tyrosine recombinase XerC [Burkholderiales bacterium]|nr:tyrosine recombinase XerC [Burkholderiales bacterium]
MGQTSPGTNQRLLERFLSHLRHERGLSKNTAENYARDVRSLFSLAGETALSAIHPQQARRFVALLHGRGLQGRTLARTLSAWRSFYRYLARDHGVACNPFQGIRAPKAPKTLPKALSPDEAARLVDLSGDDPMTLRDRAMFELFYSSGLRLSELTALELAEVDFQDGTVRVTGKGNKTRVVPVGELAQRALQDWLGARRALADPEQSALFVGRSGLPVGPRTVQRRLAAWAIRQGLSQHVHPHMLRHSFASHVLQSSGDLRAVQEMLGHASISTTQVYTHLDFQYLAKVYDAAHPRAKRGVSRRQDVKPPKLSKPES